MQTMMALCNEPSSILVPSLSGVNDLTRHMPPGSDFMNLS